MFITFNVYYNYNIFILQNSSNRFKRFKDIDAYILQDPTHSIKLPPKEDRVLRELINKIEYYRDVCYYKIVYFNERL